MNLFGVTCVKNEGDIIEAFVRHNLCFLNRLIVLDHGSTDDTSAILRSLQLEGLALEVVRDDSLGKFQGEKMTGLMRQAAQAGADWVFLLDGDELIKTTSRDPLVFPMNSSGVLKIKWENYCAQKEDDLSQINPVVRIQNRLAYEPYHDGSFRERKDQMKLVVRKDIALNPEAYVLQGNHELSLAGVELEGSLLESCSLAHYSLRSPSQYASKISINALQKLSNPSIAAAHSSFYVKHLEMIRKDYRQFCDRFYELLPSFINLDGCAALKIKDPLVYVGGVLRYTRSFADTTHFISNLISHSEALARSHGQQNHKVYSEKQAELTLTLLGDSFPDDTRKSVRQLVGSVVLETISLPLEVTAKQNSVDVEFRGVFGLVECTKIRFFSLDGRLHELLGQSLLEALMINGSGRRVGHDHYFVFIKGQQPASLKIKTPLLGSKGEGWCRMELDLYYDTNPATIGVRFFQTNPFTTEFSLQKNIEDLEKTVSRLVTLRGFIHHQLRWVLTTLGK
jgi:glycosyltransferase involved in cell wall biosynthesis